jgi:hypothetical protein
MTAPALSSSFVVFQTACRSAGEHRLYLGKAFLYRSHLRLAGWTRRGRYHRMIEVPDVASVGWTDVPGRPNLILTLHGGEVLGLRVNGAALWRLMLEKRLTPPRAAAGKATYRHQVVYAAASSSSGAVARDLLHRISGDGGGALPAPAIPSPAAAPRTPGR